MRTLAISLLALSCTPERSADVPAPSASAEPPPAASAAASAPAPAPSPSATHAPPANAQALATCCAALAARLASTPPEELDQVARALQICKQAKEGARSSADLRAALAQLPDGAPAACR